MNVITCSISQKPVSEYGVHTHAVWEIVLVLSGSMNSMINNTDYHTSKGDIMIIPPGTPHAGCAGIDYTDIYVQAENLDFSDFFIVQDTDGSVLQLFRLMHKVMLEKEHYYAMIGDGLLNVMCQYISKNHNTKYKYPFVYRMKSRIYDNLSNVDFNLSEEIAKTGFNTDYFRRCFKYEFNKTPLEYMIDLKLTQAKNLLIRNTFVSVENVAKQCGFKDSFYFSTFFKKHIGTAPLQYRKKHMEL